MKKPKTDLVTILTILISIFISSCKTGCGCPMN